MCRTFPPQLSRTQAPAASLHLSLSLLRHRRTDGRTDRRTDRPSADLKQSNRTNTHIPNYSLILIDAVSQLRHSKCLLAEPMRKQIISVNTLYLITQMSLSLEIRRRLFAVSMFLVTALSTSLIQEVSAARGKSRRAYFGGRGNEAGENMFEGKSIDHLCYCARGPKYCSH